MERIYNAAVLVQEYPWVLRVFGMVFCGWLGLWAFYFGALTLKGRFEDWREGALSFIRLEPHERYEITDILSGLCMETIWLIMLAVPLLFGYSLCLQAFILWLSIS